MKQEEARIPYFIAHSLSKIDNIFEMRLLSWLFAKAQCVLKIYERDLKFINLQHAVDVVRLTIPANYLTPGMSDYRKSRLAFSLAEKTIDYEYENVSIKLNIIAFPTLYKVGQTTYFTCVIHKLFWHAVLNFTEGWRVVDIASMVKLRSTYSVILYIIVSNQSKPIVYSYAKIRAMLGATAVSYSRTNHFKTRILEPAKKELERYCTTTFDYTLTHGSKLVEPTLTLVPKQNVPVEVPTADEKAAVNKLKCRLSDDVQFALVEKFGLSDTQLNTIEALLLRIGSKEAQLDFIESVFLQSRFRRVKNSAGYLFAAARNFVPQG